MRVRLVALFFLLAGCGDPGSSPDPSAVLAVLDARAGVLSPELKLHWMDTGLDPLRTGQRIIQAGSAIRSPSESSAKERAVAADVILVADFHDLDPCRRAFVHAVRTLSTASARSAGRVAIALESVPLTMEAQLRAARRQSRDEGADPLVDTLRRCWTWPILETAALLRAKDLAPCPLLGAGRVTKTGFPPEDTPDAQRNPGIGPLVGTPVEDWKYGADFNRGNQNALARVGGWLRAEPRRQAFVLYGAAHLLGARNLAERFRAAGLEVLVLVPFLPEWEAALRRRFGAEASQSWYEVLPGVLRPPFVSDDCVLDLGLPAATAPKSPPRGG
ncbi:MAG: hypothetical protein ACYTGZ_05330 [Planctomycetota bacterium]|jgi:hypothetical protein